MSFLLQSFNFIILFLHSWSLSSVWGWCSVLLSFLYVLEAVSYQFQVCVFGDTYDIEFIFLLQSKALLKFYISASPACIFLFNLLWCRSLTIIALLLFVVSYYLLRYLLLFLVWFLSLVLLLVSGFIIISPISILAEWKLSICICNIPSTYVSFHHSLPFIWLPYLTYLSFHIFFFPLIVSS